MTHIDSADRLVFRIDDAAWQDFVAVLDRPAQTIPALAELLAEVPPWAEGEAEALVSAMRTT